METSTFYEAGRFQDLKFAVFLNKGDVSGDITIHNLTLLAKIARAYRRIHHLTPDSSWRRGVFVQSVLEHPTGGTGADRLERGPKRSLLTTTVRRTEQPLSGALFGGVVRGDPGRRLPDRTSLRRSLARSKTCREHRLAPGVSGTGIGTKLLEDLISESEASAKPLSIHVERFNPALRLYGRPGFREVSDKGVYLLMQRAPGTS